MPRYGRSRDAAPCCAGKWWIAALLVAGLFVSCVAALASDPRLDTARRLIEERKPQEAEPILLELIDADDENHEANFLLARVSLAKQDHNRAVRYGERAVDLADSVSEYSLWLARAYLAKAMESGIINAFRYARKGKGAYENALYLDSTNVEARFELCMYLLAAPGIVGGNKDRGIRQAEIIETQDSLYGAYAWAGVHERENELDRAEASLKRAVELDTSSTYYARYALGYFYERHERYDEAIAVFRDILAKKPDEMVAVFQVGKICAITESDLDEAETCFKRYLEVEAPPNAPDRAAAHWRLGMVYDIQGKTDLAITELRMAVELAPHNKDFRRTLKEVERKLED